MHTDWTIESLPNKSEQSDLENCLTYSKDYFL